MFRIDPPHLLWALENLRDGRLVNVVAVPEPVASEAKIALDRMLEIT
jgi:quinolinate synthase